jgi:hypothetical protein
MKELICIIALLGLIVFGAWFFNEGLDKIKQDGLKSVVMEIWEGEDKDEDKTPGDRAD